MQRNHSKRCQNDQPPGARVMPPATFGQVLGLTLERGGLFECEPLRQSSAALGQRDPAAAAKLEAPAARRCR